MVRFLYFIGFVVLFLSACKKDKMFVTPEASFNVSGDTSQSITLGIFDQYSLINTSINANQFTWDFGNGTTSKEEQELLSYTKAGTYTLTLTAINEGRKSVASKLVQVVQPVLKQVVINTLEWNSGFGRPSTWPTFDRANVWVEIVQGAPNQNYPVLSNGTFDAPVIYKSNVAANINSNTIPLAFDVPRKIVIDIPTLQRNFGYTGRGYGINLYAQDATGTYLLTSNFWSGVSTNYRGSYTENWFRISTGYLGVAVDLLGDYE